MFEIRGFSGREILDSRGRPTVSATCKLADGTAASVSVPSGASTGKAEAHELRDGDPARYAGLGCRRAAANVSGEINAALQGQAIDCQENLDRLLIQLDGTPAKSRLGANAILAASLAFAAAAAASHRVPLYQYLADVAGLQPMTLPRPTINLFSGGKHAGGVAELQDVLVVPASPKTLDACLAMTYAVYQSAAALLSERYAYRPLVADEGGLAPRFECAEVMLDNAVEAIERAGLRPVEDVALAVDVASSHFYKDGSYHIGGDELSAADMVDRVSAWLGHYPIVSVEDALAEDDWASWPLLLKRIGTRALVLGDDLLATNPERIARAVSARAANALVLKINQIGTLTEALAALRVARGAGWMVTVSARSGETEDSWLADLAVGWSGDQIKVGSITRSERLAKYNRLLDIERELAVPLVAWPVRSTAG